MKLNATRRLIEQMCMCLLNAVILSVGFVVHHDRFGASEIGFLLFLAISAHAVLALFAAADLFTSAGTAVNGQIVHKENRNLYMVTDSGKMRKFKIDNTEVIGSLEAGQRIAVVVTRLTRWPRMITCIDTDPRQSKEEMTV